MAYGKITSYDYWCGKCMKGLTDKDIHIGTKDIKRCNRCNKQVRENPRTIRRRSPKPKVSRANSRIKLYCHYCGKTFEVTPYRVKAKYCSLECTYKSRVNFKPQRLTV